MTNSAIWKVVVSGALALLCILTVQSFWLKNTFDLSARTFDEKVRICLRKVAIELSKMGQVQLPSYQLINQISQDYYVVNIKDAIDANSLEYYLIKEFEAVSLFTDFEYGIYDCATNQMVYGNYIQGKDGKKRRLGANDLPTYDEFVYYFGVRFPERKGYILANEWLPLIFTGILLLAMVFFTYATYEIFRQKKLSDLQKDFINNMTHEFKTPLTSIKVSSEVFAQEPIIQNNPRLQRYAQIINQQSTRLSKQIERILQIAGSTHKGISLAKEELSLHDLIYHVIEQLKGRIEKRQADISFDLNSSNDLIQADRLHFSSVLFNLIDNALKYSQNQPHIHIKTASNSGGVLALSNTDQGVGIDPQYLSKLGNKFFRVPTGNIHNAKGFGLGLHYVKQVVQAHGWDMKIQSTRGQGTTIIIELKA